MSRQNIDILKDLCSFDAKTSSSMDRLTHDRYMILIGRLKMKEDIDILEQIIEASRTTSTEERDENQAEYEVINSEELELILEYITLEGRTDQLEDQRKNHLVYEDNFNSSLIDMIEERSSYEKLKKVCRKYEMKECADVNKVMAEHEVRVAQSQTYFRQKNLSPDEAKALALSLSFYTGTKSEVCNCCASLIARKGNGEIVEKRIEEEMNEAPIILYYLVKALSYIPFYWGYVTRACELTDDELNMYTPGSLITWIRFSSSKKASINFNVAHRNTFFKIYSLTGRPIEQFANNQEQGEVLFLPYSTFFVFKHQRSFHGTQHTIYMRQVELGLTQRTVLWVDDHIFDENWENKKHMEYAATKALDMDIHFIPKSNTDIALSFLRSPFGQRLKNQDTFRIVTDMHRDNEKPVHNAGARLIKAIRQMGFRNKCLIFTGNKGRVLEILDVELTSREQQYVTVSEKTIDLQNFINFEQTSANEE